VSACNEYLPYPYVGKVIWTAGQRTSDHSLPFMWKNSAVSYPMSYTNWASGEPNDGATEPGGEACMALMQTSGFNTWNDVMCSVPLCFVCEIN